jgi:acetylornithine deacetylase/succinyl-diaminopimelate desuccinylase-like protein
VAVTSDISTGDISTGDAPEAAATIRDLVTRRWDEIVPVLHDYIAIPNVSEAFDPDWRANGHMQAAVDLVRDWCLARSIAGMTVSVHELPDRSPLVVVEVPAFGDGRAGDRAARGDDVVVLYGHLDKQPEMEGWREGLGPWVPVLEGDRLYGRGGADDGYSVFASLTAIEAVQASGRPHARCIVLIEASEESGSPDLPAHVDALADRIGTPSLVVCLDSGCIDYERMWVTTSLRGMVACTLTVDIVREGLHSGDVSGMVPSSFRIARSLLSRIEDERTGEVLLDSCRVDVPTERVEQASATAEEIGAIADRYPFVDGARPTTPEGGEQLLARTWRAALSVVGADGLPPTGRAGNVLRPSTSLKLSLRIPPTADPAAAAAELRDRLRADPPYGARVTISHLEHAPGWNAPATAPWLADALDAASSQAFGSGVRYFGEGGSIPFMGMLGERFPDAQFVITGVLGPDANAHGPNEYLHLPTARRITEAIASLLAAHASR